MFNVGFERGLVQGRADALAASLRNYGAPGRVLTAALVRLTMEAGLEPARAVAALLEVAWSLALGPRAAPTPPPRRSTR